MDSKKKKKKRGVESCKTRDPVYGDPVLASLGHAPEPRRDEIMKSEKLPGPSSRDRSVSVPRSSRGTASQETRPGS